MDLLTVSRVANESGSFVPKFMRTEANFTTFVNDFLPKPQLVPIRAAVERQHPAQGPPYNGDQRARAGALIRDSTFACNTRQLYEAYNDRPISLYMMQYDFLASENYALHANDLLPPFWNVQIDTAKLFEDLLHPSPLRAEPAAFAFDHSGYAPAYHSSFTSHAVFRDLNTARHWNTTLAQRNRQRTGSHGCGGDVVFGDSRIFRWANCEQGEYACFLRLLVATRILDYKTDDGGQRPLVGPRLDQNFRICCQRRIWVEGWNEESYYEAGISTPYPAFLTEARK